MAVLKQRVEDKGLVVSQTALIWLLGTVKCDGIDGRAFDSIESACETHLLACCILYELTPRTQQTIGCADHTGRQETASFGVSK